MYYIKSFDNMILFLKKDDIKNFRKEVASIRNLIQRLSGKLKDYINDVFRKAEINKASRIYEHGISLGKTAQLLGVTQWELVDYMGQKKTDEKYSVTDIRKRAQSAVEFFS